MPDLAFVEFQSQATIGIVYVELGFIPDNALLVSDYAGVPTLKIWSNNTRYPGWPANTTASIVGASGAFAPDTTTIIAPYAGGDVVSANETTATAGKHVDRTGTAAQAGHITSQGVALSATHGVNSGRNLLIAFRGDR